MTPSDLTRLDAQLQRLQLHYIKSHYHALATRAAEQQRSHLDYLEQLVGAVECAEGVSLSVICATFGIVGGGRHNSETRLHEQRAGTNSGKTARTPI